MLKLNGTVYYSGHETLKITDAVDTYKPAETDTKATAAKATILSIWSGK